MNIILYNTNSNPLELNKILNQVGECTGQITNNCDVIKPIFELQTNNFNFNYIFCDDNKFKRYYFVNKIEVMRGNIIKVYCDVDVLQTYKNDVLNADIIAERSTSSYNKYIPDNLDFITAKKRLSFSRLPFSFNTEEINGNHYILTIGGK